MMIISSLIGCQKQESEVAYASRGAAQVAALWTAEDGSPEEMQAFIAENTCPDDSSRLALFEQLSRIYEHLFAASDNLTVELLRPTALTNASEPGTPDWMMSSYNPNAHLADDLFANKLAFLTILNFPHYSLAEKDSLGREWSRQEWAFARMGDLFIDRVPASVNQAIAKAQADAENYIADYNIHTAALVDAEGNRLWDEDLVLLSHWNLRDELKADYTCPAKQEMIYQVMQRIVRQEIPAAVINSADYTWCPYSNRTWLNGQKVHLEREVDVRYQRILDHFHAYQRQDACCPAMPTAIERHFEGETEIPAAQLEQLFTELVAAPEMGRIAALIAQRLGRPLRPYDIWYDGFKSRSRYDENVLSAITRQRYPSPLAYQQDIPRMLLELGFAAEDAEDIASHIVVEPARGSGHAWPSLGDNAPARLRTRIAPEGMDYKGYNIAVHEMGHNVEEVLSLYRMDYYMLSGIPNSGFTEASAFLFQQRDLQLLGLGHQERDTMAILDQVWGMYEIMGVSLVDMRLWRWLYAHPKADAAQLRDAALTIAREVWNQYYAPLLGEPDCCLLAIYSHMVDVPMYLPNYPIGSLVQFQLEAHLAALESAAFAQEYERIYRLGRLTPNAWMKAATGQPLSVRPILDAVAAVME